MVLSWRVLLTHLLLPVLLTGLDRKIVGRQRRLIIHRRSRIPQRASVVIGIYEYCTEKGISLTINSLSEGSDNDSF